MPALVVLAGPTGSGKSTLARHLARDLDLHPLAASTVLLRVGVSDRRKLQRLRSWVDTPEQALAGRRVDPQVDRLADLTTLNLCRDTDRDLVVETACPTALLQPPHNISLLVLLDADPAVRATRVRDTLGGTVTLPQARQIIERKDRATTAAVAAAWAVDLTDPAAAAWRFDLVIRCPDLQECRSQAECLNAARDLTAAAAAVYRQYLAGAPAAAACTQLGDLAKRWSRWLVRLAPALLDRAGPHTPGRWRDRLYHELSNGRRADHGDVG